MTISTKRSESNPSTENAIPTLRQRGVFARVFFLIVDIVSGGLGCASTPVSAQKVEDRARMAVERLVSSGQVPGVQYVVVGSRGVLFSAVAGVRDVASAETMEDETIQLAYSTTKVITAIAVLQLVERGKMALDAPLSRYYGDHPYGERITIRQLLAHTAGVPDPMPLDWFSIEGESINRDSKLRQLLEDNPRLRYQPGTKYGYSNLGYWLLEKAVESAAQRDFATYMQDNVFRPLGITDAEARFVPDGPGEMAVGHTSRFSPVAWVLGWMTPAGYWNETHGRWRTSARVRPLGRGYGGLFVTAGALARILQDLLADESILFGTQVKAAMFEAQRLANGKCVGTLGWIFGELAGVSYFGKQGGGLGFHGNVRIYPKHRIATVMLVNRTEVSAGPIDSRSDSLDVAFLEKNDGMVPLPQH